MDAYIRNKKHMKTIFLSFLFFSFLSSSAWADFKKGVAAYEAGDVASAFKEFRASAEKGDADSQYNLGLMYEQGIGISKDETQAVGWYRKSSEQGNSNAQYNLAVLYENGRGTPVDFAQAHLWYRKALVQGDALAGGNLGMLYMRSQGVREDKVAGLALLLLSVMMDNSPENHAKQNISLTQGLTPEMVKTAQTLSAEMINSPNPLLPLDQYLKNGQKH